ncbi:MAG: branched-chain amino acid ABC transporter permease [Alphaproteobacteria bacterium]|nr:branched-chain amino acid ABC transporter permease [Alphaproteobacteria bacterium]
MDILVVAPHFALQLLIDGILFGAIFALAAYGMALVWGVMNIINITQGEFVMLGGFVTVALAKAGFNPFFGIPAAAVVLFVVGWLIYRLAIFRIVDRDLFISLLATFGISIFLQQLMNQVFGADPESVDTGLGTLLLLGGDVTVAGIKLVSFSITILVAVTLFLFLRYSRIGQAVRATAQNARAARIMGVDTDRVYALSYSLNAAICGVAGSLVAMTWVIQAFNGLAYTVRSFMIVIVAGLGNLPGVIAAALGLGTAENFVDFVFGSEFRLAFVFSLLVVILVLRSLWAARKRQYLK